MPNTAVLLDRIATALIGLSDVDCDFPVLDRTNALLAAGAALDAIQGAYVPPPPGSDKAALPADVRAAIRPHMPPYISTYEQTADACEAAIPDHPDMADELRLWAARMRASCRLTRKQDMAPCQHPKHRRIVGPADDGEAPR